jgi:hypothetical protein
MVRARRRAVARATSRRALTLTPRCALQLPGAAALPPGAARAPRLPRIRSRLWRSDGGRRVADDAERTSTNDGVFSVPTKVVEHLVGGSDLHTLVAAGAWIYEDDLDALLAVCRDTPEAQGIADDLAYILLHLGDDVIDMRRVYVLRRPPFGPVELVARGTTTDEVLVITPLPMQGVRVAEHGIGLTHVPPRTYVDGKLVRR